MQTNNVPELLLLLEYHIDSAIQLINDIDDCGCEVTLEQDNELVQIITQFKNFIKDR